MSLEVAVIGGGIGGLSAALQLLKVGLDVHVTSRRRLSPTYLRQAVLASEDTTAGLLALAQSGYRLVGARAAG